MLGREAENDRHHISEGELQEMLNNIESECSACAHELENLAMDETGLQEQTHNHATVSSIVESAFSIVETPDDHISSEDLDALVRFVHGAEEGTASDVDDHEDIDYPELDSPEMFEYMNPGTRMEYTDTDVDLERSLDLREVLEFEYCAPDSSLSFRNENFEAQSLITEENVRKGMDMQGIRWKKSIKNARQEYRDYRVSTYENYFNHDGPFQGKHTIQTHLPPDRSFLRFVQNEREFKCSLIHFQLRNLLHAVTGNQVFHADASTIKVYDPLQRTCRTFMDLSEKSHVYPFKISSMAVTANYCCVGGFFGEYVLQRFDASEPSDPEIGIVSNDASAITNHLCPNTTRSGAQQIIIASNDSCLRKLEVETKQITQEHFFDHPINCSDTSIDNRLQLVVGDHCSATILDVERGTILRTIPGHTDFSFACAWSNDGHTFATGSQDFTTRLYDARGNMSVPTAILRAKMGAIRSLKFSECGRFLAAAEPADFIHVHNVQDTSQSQCIDFFGEISGIDFCGDSFFIGNADRTMGGIAEFRFRRDHLGLEDAFI